MDIAGWRKKIDGINRQIVGLLNKRARCAIEIGKIKGNLGRPVHDAEREKNVLNMVAESNRGPLNKKSMSRIFKTIIAENKKLEKQALARQ